MIRSVDGKQSGEVMLIFLQVQQKNALWSDLPCKQKATFISKVVSEAHITLFQSCRLMSTLIVEAFPQTRKSSN